MSSIYLLSFMFAYISIVVVKFFFSAEVINRVWLLSKSGPYSASSPDLELELEDYKRASNTMS